MVKAIEKAKNMGQIFTEVPEEGTWIPFFGSSIGEDGKVENDDPVKGGAEFCIRSTKKFYEERLKTRKRESSMAVNTLSRSMEKVTSFKDQTAEELMAEYEDALDYSITGIRNAFWDKTTPIKCTKEDKLRLKNIAVFDRFLAHAIELLDEGAVTQAEVVEKNS